MYKCWPVYLNLSVKALNITDDNMKFVDDDNVTHVLKPGSQFYVSVSV